MAETMKLKAVLYLLQQGRAVEPAIITAAVGELRDIENLLRLARRTRNAARQLYLDGQLDKYPTSDSGPEYRLWRLVKKKEDE